MRIKPLLLGLITLFVTYTAAQASVLFWENFESGSLTSPRWVDPNQNVFISNTISASPSYSARLEGKNAWLYTRDFTALPLASTTDKIEVSFDVYRETPGVANRLISLQTNAVNTPLTGLTITANGKFQISGADGAIVGDYVAQTWYHVSFVLSLAQKTFDISIHTLDGTLVGSLTDLDFFATAGANLGALYFYNDAANQTTYIDNVRIASIPEPGRLGLLGFAIGAGAFTATRRRKLC